MATVTVAVDIMGSDNGHMPIVSGAINSAARNHQVRYKLVGTKEAIAQAEAVRNLPLNIRFVESRDAIYRDEKAESAFRKKRGCTSIHKATSLLLTDEAQAVVSFGSTAAQVLTSNSVLGRVTDEVQPAIAACIPNMRGGITLLLDAGAVPERNPYSLFTCALMGSAYMSSVLGISLPRVGLLNIGSEPHKGLDYVKTASELFYKPTVPPLPFHYTGFVEGHNLTDGSVDVVVCKGEIGNIALKVAEGVAESIVSSIRDDFHRTPWSRVVGLPAKQCMKPTAKRFSCQESGGMPILGFNGNVIAAHGRSGQRSVETALDFAIRSAHGTDLHKRIRKHLCTYPSSVMLSRDSTYVRLSPTGPLA